MKIVTPEQFEVEQKENLLYVGRIRAADYIWVHRSGADNSLVHLEYIAKDLQGDILVPQKTNNDDWSWANYHLSGRVGMDDTIFVAAGDLYRDSTMQRKAQYISNELLEQIEPQLESLGSLEEMSCELRSMSGEPRIDSGSAIKDAKWELLDKATKTGADYVVLTNSWVGDWWPSVPCIFGTAIGTAYKIKRNESAPKAGIETAPSIKHPTFVPEQFAHDSQAVDYAKRLLTGTAKGTIMDWKKSS